MKATGEQASYSVDIEGCDPMTNRWGEEFDPDKVEAYWLKDEHGSWVIEVVTISGVGFLKKTGELGKLRRSNWFTYDTANELPDSMWSLVLENRPVNAVVRVDDFNGALRG